MKTDFVTVKTDVAVLKQFSWSAWRPDWNVDLLVGIHERLPGP